MGLYYKSQKRFCAKEEKNISIVKNREGRDTRVCEESAKKKVYLTIKITTDITSVLYTKEGQKKENSTGLQIYEQLND